MHRYATPAPKLDAVLRYVRLLDWPADGAMGGVTNDMKKSRSTSVMCTTFMFIAVGCSGTPDPTPQAESSGRFAAYAGRYALDPISVLEVEAHDDLLSIVPPFWTSKPYYGTNDGRTFSMELPSPKPHRQVTFDDFVDGKPGTLSLEAVDRRYDGKRFRRLGEDERTAVEAFLAGDPQGAATLALNQVEDDRLRQFALDLLINYRSRVADAAVMLGRLAAERPEHAGLRSLYAHALVAVGRRDEALQQFEEAYALDPEERSIDEGLRRLRFTEPPAGQGYRAVLPFTLSQAFGPATEMELAAVRERWSRRDLSPRDVEHLATETVVLEHARFEARVLRHTVHGDAHHGVVLVPQASDQGRLPAVIDVRGVDPSYSPMDVSHATKSLRALGPAQDSFVFLVPGLRGNTLILDRTEYVSEGDPSDAWDGATDDALAFLNAALERVPEIDPRRIAVLGYSRGGTVALLAGIRDPRISLVLGVVGPVDQLRAMDSSLGWTTAEILADALRDGTIPTIDELGGQDFDHWLDRVPDGETLADVRARLIASSPLYFVEGLPETHTYYGSEDRSVPPINAELLRERLKATRRPNRDTTVRVFDLRGHDTDPLLVQRETVRHLTTWAADER